MFAVVDRAFARPPPPMDIQDSCDPGLRSPGEEMPEENHHHGLGFDDGGDDLHRHMEHMRLELPGNILDNVTEMFVDGAALAFNRKDVMISTAEHSPPVGLDKVVLVLYGKVDNDDEMRDLYGLPQAEDPLPYNATSRSAELLMSLYLKEYVDAYGDPSAQPATCLDAMQGDFSFVLFDASCRYLLAARDPGGRAPLFWGTADKSGSLLFGTDSRILTNDCGKGASAPSEFPVGSFFESDDTEEYGYVKSYVRRGLPMKGIGRVDSHGQLCGTMFRVASGDGIAAMRGAGSDLPAQWCM